MSSKLLSKRAYDNIVKKLPLACVDIIPVRKQAGKWQIGIITRGTGPESGKPAVLGGRIFHGEQIPTAIKRHMRESWGLKNLSFVEGNSVERPFYLQQYLHQASARPPLGYDPTKHSITPTYLIQIYGQPKAQNEAAGFSWIEQHEIPKVAAYNQHIVMHEAFNYIKNRLT